MFVCPLCLLYSLNEILFLFQKLTYSMYYATWAVSSSNKVSPPKKTYINMYQRRTSKSIPKSIQTLHYFNYYVAGYAWFIRFDPSLTWKLVSESRVVAFIRLIDSVYHLLLRSHSNYARCLYHPTKIIIISLFPHLIHPVQLYIALLFK